jgi:hypothetical protein
MYRSDVHSPLASIGIIPVKTRIRVNLSLFSTRKVEFSLRIALIYPSLIVIGLLNPSLPFPYPADSRSVRLNRRWIQELGGRTSEFQKRDRGSTMNKETSLITLNCYHQSRSDYQLIRQDILASWTGRFPEAELTDSMTYFVSIAILLEIWWKWGYEFLPGLSLMNLF